VADDVVNVVRRKEGDVTGYGNDIIQHHMEIRGLGIINIKDLFGVAAVRERKKIELVVELIEWEGRKEYDRLGMDMGQMNIVGVEVPHAVVPVRPGRNMTTIIEVAARNHLLKLQGHHSAQEFADRLSAKIARARADADDDDQPEVSGVSAMDGGEE
jgi:HPr kinase/phosphorylase